MATAAAAISGLSVETITESKHPLSIAAMIVQCISGLPWKSAMFFPGRPFDPPRAGIIATVVMAVSLLRDNRATLQITQHQRTPP